jgi:hypothetical protein
MILIKLLQVCRHLKCSDLICNRIEASIVDQRSGICLWTRRYDRVCPLQRFSFLWSCFRRSSRISHSVNGIDNERYYRFHSGNGVNLFGCRIKLWRSPLEKRFRGLNSSPKSSRVCANLPFSSSASHSGKKKTFKHHNYQSSNLWETEAV